MCSHAGISILVGYRFAFGFLRRARSGINSYFRLVGELVLHEPARPPLSGVLRKLGTHPLIGSY